MFLKILGIILNRTERVGKPLASRLLDINLTPTLAHSHSNFKYLLEYSYIVNATGSGIVPIETTTGNTIIDVTGEYSKTPQAKEYGLYQPKQNVKRFNPVYSNIGRLTTSMLMNDLVSNWNE